MNTIQDKGKLIALFFLVFIYTLNLNAQSNSMNQVVHATYHQWKFNKNGCINKWSVTFENKTQRKITSITFRLIIENKETGVFRYKKTHTVYLTLSANEIVPSPYFNLSQELCGLEYIETLEGYNLYIEVISFK